MTYLARRAAVTGLLLLFTAAPSFGPAPPGTGRFGTASAIAATRPTKSVQDCNDELRDKAAAIAEAGMSASAFFHACWWHSEPGKPTPIVADPRSGAPFARRASRLASSDGDAAARPSRRGSRQHAERRRIEAGSFAPRRSFPAEPGEEVGALVTRPPLDDLPPRAAPQVRNARKQDASEPQATEPTLPTKVQVNVPVVGSVAVPILPVPGLAATVRIVVDHPVVPGLVTAAP